MTTHVDIDSAIVPILEAAMRAPSSHNTQCWTFALEDRAVVIRPDLARRCPAVDPDDHHVFVSLGCACENHVQAAQAHRLNATARFDVAQPEVLISGSQALLRMLLSQRTLDQRVDLTQWAFKATVRRLGDNKESLLVYQRVGQ